MKITMLHFAIFLYFSYFIRFPCCDVQVFLCGEIYKSDLLLLVFITLLLVARSPSSIKEDERAHVRNSVEPCTTIISV
jgi:hypothetical protein